ncbi:MAG: peptide chain release factor N(5)-glutamine methyltransferase [Bacteroidales bacterium]|nr:peptide chain release factor N(5)-glutamine methyltransferase [Bacteroidales bacterium]
MLLVDFLKEETQALESLYPAAEARNLMLMLCQELIGTQSYTHIIEPGFEVDKKDEPILEAALERLKKGEPVQYVTGVCEFCGRRFHVTPEVLIPRPETELLVQEAVRKADRIHRLRSPYGKSAEPVRVLDLCTGSGCIAWSVALEVPGVQVVGVDISEGALSVAQGQDFTTELKSTGALPPIFVKADVLDTDREFPYGPFDLILSNPPYIMEKEKSLMRSNVLDYEPPQALFVPDEDPLLFYRAIASWSQRFFAADGMGLTEINEELGADIQAVFTAAGFQEVEQVKDFFDKTRFVSYRK